MFSPHIVVVAFVIIFIHAFILYSNDNTVGKFKGYFSLTANLQVNFNLGLKLELYDDNVSRKQITLLEM